MTIMTERVINRVREQSDNGRFIIKKIETTRNVLDVLSLFLFIYRYFFCLQHRAQSYEEQKRQQDELIMQSETDVREQLQ